MVYSETCVSLSIPIINGVGYFQTYIDDYSRLTFTILMKAKSETMQNIERFKVFMDAKGYPIQTFITDQASEYAFKEIQDYRKVNEISHTPTGRATHSQMHMAEWIKKTLVEMARSMLIDSGSSEKKAWENSIWYATTIRNRFTTGTFNNLQHNLVRWIVHSADQLLTIDYILV